MTYNEARNTIISSLTRSGNNRISGQEVREAVLIVLDFAAAIDNQDAIPDWTAVKTFQTDGADDGKYCKYRDTNGKLRFFETKIDDNTNQAPPTDPNVTENAAWEEISASAGSGIQEWAPGFYGAGLVIVFHHHSSSGRILCILVEPVRPFNSTNIEAEITAGKWVAFTHTQNSDTHTTSPSFGIGSGGITKIYARNTGAAAGLEPQIVWVNIDGERFWKFSNNGVNFFALPTYVPENADNKNQPNGYAGLDATGKVAAAQLPSYVDDVLEFANLAAFPVAGEAGKIYIAIDTTLSYRWSGSAYVQVPSTPNNASETVAGIVEEATTTETNAGTAAGGTGAKLFVTPAKLASWWTWLKTQAVAITGQWSFLDPILSGTAYLGKTTDIGTSRTVTPQGTEANIDIFINPKGATGRVKSDSLVGVGEAAARIRADGAVEREGIIELKTWNVTTVALSKATLNSTYPSATRGMQVICASISGGGKIYEKIDDVTNDWVSINITAVV